MAALSTYTQMQSLAYACLSRSASLISLGGIVWIHLLRGFIKVLGAHCIHGGGNLAVGSSLVCVLVSEKGMSSEFRKWKVDARMEVADAFGRGHHYHLERLYRFCIRYM